MLDWEGKQFAVPRCRLREQEPFQEEAQEQFREAVISRDRLSRGALRTIKGPSNGRRYLS
jgi:hypothetical protein